MRAFDKVLISFIVIFLLLSLFGIVGFMSWNTHVRLSMLLSGYPFGEIVTPPSDEELRKEVPGLMISGTVHNNGTYVGFIDNLGFFVPKGRTTLSPAEEMRFDAFLMTSAVLSPIACVILIAVLLFRRLK